MAVNIEALVQHLMEDPDIIPPDGQSKEDIARAMATQRAKQSSNNEKALNMVKADSSINKLLTFLKADDDEMESLRSQHSEMMDALGNIGSGEVDPREFSKHQRNFEKHRKVLEAGKNFPNTTAGKRAKKEFDEAKEYLDKPGVLPNAVREHEENMKAQEAADTSSTEEPEPEDVVPAARPTAGDVADEAAIDEELGDEPDPQATAKQERDDEFFELNQRARRAGYELKNEDNPLTEDEIAALQAHEDGGDLDDDAKLELNGARRKITSESYNEVGERRALAIARPARQEAKHAAEQEKKQQAQAKADAEQAEAAEAEEEFWHPSNFPSADAHEKVMGLFGGDKDIANQFLEAYEKGGGSKSDFLNARGKVNKGNLEKIGKVEDFVKNLPATTPEQAERDKETAEEQGVEAGSPLMEARRQQQAIPDSDLEDDYADALIEELDKLGADDQLDWKDIEDELDDTDIDGYNEALVDFLNNKMDAHNANKNLRESDKISIPKKPDPAPAPVPEADKEAIASSTTEAEAEEAVQTAEHRITSSDKPVGEKVSDVKNLSSFVRETGKDKPVVGKVTSAHTPESVVVGEVLADPNTTEEDKVAALQEIPGEEEQKETLEAHDHTPSAVERLTAKVKEGQPSLGLSRSKGEADQPQPVRPDMTEDEPEATEGRQPGQLGFGQDPAQGELFDPRTPERGEEVQARSGLTGVRERRKGQPEGRQMGFDEYEPPAAKEDNIFEDSGSDDLEGDEDLPEGTFEPTPIESADAEHGAATDQGWGGPDVDEGHFEGDGGDQKGPQGYPQEVRDYAIRMQTELGINIIGDNNEPHDNVYTTNNLGDNDPVTIEHIQNYIQETTGDPAPKADWQGGTTTEQETQEDESEGTGAEQGTTETDESETSGEESTTTSGDSGETEPKSVDEPPPRQGQQRLGDAPGGEDFRRRKDGDVAQPIRTDRGEDEREPEGVPEGQRSFEDLGEEGTQLGFPGMPRAERATPTETTEEGEPQPEGVPEGQQSFDDYRQSTQAVEDRRADGGIPRQSPEQRAEAQRTASLDKKRQDLVSNFNQDQDYVDSLSDEKLEAIHSKHTDKKQELNANQEIQSSAAKTKRAEILQAMARAHGKEGDEDYMRELEEKHEFDDPKDLIKLHREQQARRAENEHKDNANQANADAMSMSEVPEGIDKHDAKHRLREITKKLRDHRNVGEKEGKELLDRKSIEHLRKLGHDVANHLTSEDLDEINQEANEMGDNFMNDAHKEELEAKYDKSRAHHKEAIDHISSESSHEDRVHAFDHSRAHELHHVDEDGNVSSVSHSKMGEDGKAIHTDEGTHEDAHGGRTASKPPKLLGLDKDGQADQAAHFELAKKYHDPKYVGKPEFGSAKAGLDRMKELEAKNPQLADPKYKGQLMGGQGSHLNSELGGQQMSDMGMSENEQEEARMEAGKPPAGGPPRPGLVWAPGIKHWVKPETLREMQGGMSAGGGTYMPMGIAGHKADGTEGNSGPAMVTASGLHPGHLPTADGHTDSMGGHGDMAGHILGQALNDHHNEWDEKGQKGNAIKVDKKLLDSTGINHSEVHGGGGGGAAPTPGPQAPTPRQQALDSSNEGKPSDTGVQRQANRRGDPKASPLAEALMRARGHTSEEAKGRTMGQEYGRSARKAAGELPVIGSLFRGDSWKKDRIQDKVASDNKSQRAVDKLTDLVRSAKQDINRED